MRTNHFIFGLALATVMGCQTVHTSRQGTVPVAMWPGLILTAQQGQSLPSGAQEVIAAVLRDNGLHPKLDEGGVSVPEAEETRAREVLLTDARLKKTEVIVLLGIPAGTGRKTANGFEVPAVAPSEPMVMPPDH